MQEIWCKTARLQYTISETVMSTHLMLSNFGVNRTAGDISNALSECEMQAKEQMLPFVSIQLDMNRIFFSNVASVVKSDVLVQRAGLAFANLEVWNLDDFWDDFSSTYIYIYIIFLYMFFVSSWPLETNSRHIGSWQKISSCRLQSDPKTKGEDQVGLHCSWNRCLERSTLVTVSGLDAIADGP